MKKEKKCASCLSVSAWVTAAAWPVFKYKYWGEIHGVNVGSVARDRGGVQGMGWWGYVVMDRHACVCVVSHPYPDPPAGGSAWRGRVCGWNNWVKPAEGDSGNTDLYFTLGNRNTPSAPPFSDHDHTPSTSPSPLVLTVPVKATFRALQRFIGIQINVRTKIAVCITNVVLWSCCSITQCHWCCSSITIRVSHFSPRQLPYQDRLIWA